MSNYSPGQKKIVAFIKSKQPDLTDKELSTLLSDLKRFVNLARKIYTEPQAKVDYKISKNEAGEKEEHRTFHTDLNELAKVRNDDGQEPINQVLWKLHSSLSGVKVKNR